MSNIPEARKILEGVRGRVASAGLNHSARQIDRAIALMTREPLARPRSPKQSEKVTPRLERQIRRLADAGLSQQTIAEEVNVNQGRVSEVLHQRRSP